MSDARGIALIVGLNSVNPVSYDDWDGELRVCETDADDMNRLATSQGFSTTVLKTAQATRQAVIDEIRNAADALSTNDIFFLYYSGHGAWIWDMSGDERDRRDETWCLYDGELIDDELLDLWSRFRKGTRILVILDSCHSGSGVKGRRHPASRRTIMPLGPIARPKGRACEKRMPESVVKKNHESKHDFYEELVAALPRERRPIQASVRLISGCQDHESALTFEFMKNSLFTDELLRVWGNGLFEGSYADFHSALLSRLFEIQRPNHYLIGVLDRAYDAQKPFTI